MQNAENVSAAKPNAAGAIWSAPAGTAAPTDAKTPLDEAFNSLGYVSDSGIVNTIEGDTEQVTAFGGDTVMDMKKSHKESYKFTPIETNKYSLAETYGDENVIVDDKGALKVVHNGKERAAKLYVIEILMNANRVKRIVIPRGKVVGIGDVSYVDGAPIGAELTLSALPDEQGNTAYEYIAEVV